MHLHSIVAFTDFIFCIFPAGVWSGER